MPQRGITFIPVLLVCPVRVVRQTVDDGIEARVAFSSFEEIERLLMYFPADRIAIRARRGQEKPERLFSGVAGALGHNVVERAGRLCVKLVEDARRNVQTVFGGDLARKHLIDAPRGLIHHAFGGRDDLDVLSERGVLLHHIDGDVKHDARLLAVGSAGVHLRFPLVVVHQHIERQRRAEFAIVRRHHGASGKVLMRWTVHLDTAHLNRVRQRLYTAHIMKTGTSLFDTFPFAVIFAVQSRCRLILEGVEPYGVQRFSRWLIEPCGRPFRHGVLYAEAPKQFSHRLRERLDRADVDALRFHGTNAAVRVHEPLQQRPTLGFRRS